MLTKEASNAFLKVLEEPPAHVIFVLVHHRGAQGHPHDSVALSKV